MYRVYRVNRVNRVNRVYKVNKVCWVNKVNGRYEWKVGEREHEFNYEVSSSFFLFPLCSLLFALCSLLFVIWNLEFGIWDLLFGIWNLLFVFLGFGNHFLFRCSTMASTARRPLNTALSIVAGSPVLIQSPARKKFPIGVCVSGRILVNTGD